jgi:hypothetical protein
MFLGAQRRGAIDGPRSRLGDLGRAVALGRGKRNQTTIGKNDQTGGVAKVFVEVDFEPTHGRFVGLGNLRKTALEASREQADFGGRRTQ